MPTASSGSVRTGIEGLDIFRGNVEVRQAISLMMTRTGMHVRTIREIAFSAQGIKVGEPIHHMQGVLTGVPTIVES